jgi:hypothetical protein
MFLSFQSSLRLVPAPCLDSSSSLYTGTFDLLLPPDICDPGFPFRGRDGKVVTRITGNELHYLGL